MTGPVANLRLLDKRLQPKPGDLAVEELSTTVLAVNFKRARELGLTVPPALEMRTDHAIR